MIPLRVAAVETALRLNGTSVDDNLAALRWGRLLAHAPDQLLALLAADTAPENQDAMREPAAAIGYFAAQLTTYQNAAYATRFKTVINSFIDRLTAAKIPTDAIAISAARVLFRAMAIKDEYEVARQLTSADFIAKINMIGGEDMAVNYHLAPPLLNWRKNRDGTPRKIRFGPWLTPVLRMIARLSWLRDSRIDPFGFTAERKSERAHREAVINWLDQLGTNASSGQYEKIETALELMLKIRGYGHVKAKNMTQYEQEISAIISTLSTQPPPFDIAAE